MFPKTTMRLTFENATTLYPDSSLGHLRDYRGIYVIYSTGFDFDHPRGWNSIAYIGSGWVGERLGKHVGGQGNPEVHALLGRHGPGRGSLRFVWGDASDEVRARTAEALLLGTFVERYGALPLCNRREESPPFSRIRGVRFNKDIIAERHGTRARPRPRS